MMSLPEFKAFQSANPKLLPEALYDAASARCGLTFRWLDRSLMVQCQFLDLMANAPSSPLVH